MHRFVDADWLIKHSRLDGTLSASKNSLDEDSIFFPDSHFGNPIGFLRDVLRRVKTKPRGLFLSKR